MQSPCGGSCLAFSQDSRVGWKEPTELQVVIGEAIGEGSCCRVLWGLPFSLSETGSPPFPLRVLSRSRTESERLYLDPSAVLWRWGQSREISGSYYNNPGKRSWAAWTLVGGEGWLEFRYILQIKQKTFLHGLDSLCISMACSLSHNPIAALRALCVSRLLTPAFYSTTLTKPSILCAKDDFKN